MLSALLTTFSQSLLPLSPTLAPEEKPPSSLLSLRFLAPCVISPCQECPGSTQHASLSLQGVTLQAMPCYFCKPSCLWVSWSCRRDLFAMMALFNSWQLNGTCRLLLKTSYGFLSVQNYLVPCSRTLFQGRCAKKSSLLAL